MSENEKYWRDFEARDRANNPAAWAVHDYMTRRQEPKRRPSVLPLKIVFVVALILLAILLTQ